ncbi:S1 family peptidase [Pendulispora rubella]|uniref:S1 family peptidase n=1 Tax=Pendulispora rubella TaxID=2741070 RepID=A0ABZ2L8K2_9BACT
MRTSKNYLLALTVALASGCSAKDGTEAIGASDDELVGAPLDSEHLFSVGVCTGNVNPDGSCPVSGTANTSRCSGTLVAPNLVITSRHCVERMNPPTSDRCTGSFNGTAINASVQITTSSTVYQSGSTWHRVESIRTPQGTKACTDDVALLTLATKVDIEPASVYLKQSSIELDLRQGFAMVGRGWFALRFDPETHERIEYDTGNLERRKRENIPFVCKPTETTPCSVYDLFASPPSATLVPGTIGYAAGTASGDSGAGLIPKVLFDKAHHYGLVAIHATTMTGPDGRQGTGQGLLLEPHANLIREAARAAAQRGAYPVPDWAL